MEEKTEAVKSEETTVGLTMNYNPFSFISCQRFAWRCAIHAVPDGTYDLLARAR